MTTFKRIALWGVGGENIGGHIIEALVDDSSYEVTVLARKSSKSTYPTDLRVVRIEDDLSHESLVAGMSGQDVVISAVGPAGALDQVNVATAAVEAGVRRFIPSEYGFDNEDPNNIELSPVFKTKSEVARQLRDLAHSHPGFSWTALATNIWLDWALDVKFLDIDTEQHTVAYWDEGTHAPSMTTLPYAAQGVLEILKHPDQFHNQRVFMQAFTATQKEIVAELERQQGVKYQSTSIDGAETVRKAHETLAKGFDQETVYTTIKAAVWLSKYGSDFVAKGKQPILEQVVDMPRLALQDVVREHVAKQK